MDSSSLSEPNGQIMNTLHVKENRYMENGFGYNTLSNILQLVYFQSVPKLYYLHHGSVFMTIFSSF